MWRITTRGFTLEEVLILAAMNVAAGTDSSPQALAKDGFDASVKGYAGTGEVDEPGQIYMAGI